MAVIKKKEKAEPKITRSYRIRADLVRKIEEIALDRDESRTYILESLLDYAIEAHEKEKSPPSRKASSFARKLRRDKTAGQGVKKKRE